MKCVRSLLLYYYSPAFTHSLAHTHLIRLVVLITLTVTVTHIHVRLISLTRRNAPQSTKHERRETIDTRVACAEQGALAVDVDVSGNYCVDASQCHQLAPSYTTKAHICVLSAVSLQ